MKALKNPVALTTLLVLQACSSQSPQSGAADLTSPPATLDKPETIQPQTFMLRGKVIVVTRANTSCLAAATSNIGCNYHHNKCNEQFS